MNLQSPTESTAATQIKFERFHGLDCARAAAMLFGVFYHLPIAFMGGNSFGGPPSPKMAVDNWLHSFRMPLFFLISGFFASMMLAKYGLVRYLRRRWWRIGAPLFVSLLVLFGYRYTVEQVRLARAAANPATPALGFGFPGMGFGPPPTAGPNPAIPGPPGRALAGGAGMAPGGGFPAPPPPTNGAAPFNGPGIPNGGPRTDPFGGGFGPTPQPGAPPIKPFPFPFPFPDMPSREWSTRLFGDLSRHLALEHLWFLWYLLVLVTLGPFAAGLCSRLASLAPSRFTDGVAHQLLRWNLAGLALGLIGLPALLHAKGWMGWSLANPLGFLGVFPDFLLQYYADWPHYGLYFLVGWWLFRRRADLISLEAHWKWAVALGVAGFWASQWLADAYARQTEDPHYAWIRLAGFALYGVGAAYSAFGFLGFFQRYLNQPSRIGRYLADTALWVYLVHLPLIPYVIGWVEPWRTSWWEATLGGMLLVTGICLALYELIVRPTPLVYLYGPATVAKKKDEERVLNQPV